MINFFNHALITVLLHILFVKPWSQHECFFLPSVYVSECWTAPNGCRPKTKPALNSTASWAEFGNVITQETTATCDAVSSRGSIAARCVACRKYRPKHCWCSKIDRLVDHAWHSHDVTISCWSSYMFYVQSELLVLLQDWSLSSWWTMLASSQQANF